MTTLFATGWEHGVSPTVAGGGLASAVVGSPTVNAASKYSGNYGLECNTISPASAYFSLVFTPHSKVTVSFRVKVVSTGGNPNFMLRMTGQTQWLYFAVRDSVTGCFALHDGTAYTNWAAYTTGTWYTIQFVFDGANKTVDGWINGVAQPQVVIANTNVYDSLDFGSISGATMDLCFDDLVVTDGAGTFPLASTYKVEGLLPTSDGTHNAGTVIQNQAGTVLNGGAAPAYSLLDELPMTSSADYVQQTGTGNYYAEVNFANIASGSILGVQAVLAYQGSTTTGDVADTRICLSGSSDFILYSGNMATTTLSYKSAQVSAPGGGWTQSSVNALTGRVGYATSVAGSTPYWQGLMLEVAYVPGDYTLAAGTGAFTLTGVAAAFIAPMVLTAETGVFTLTGIPAGLVGIGGSSMGLLLALHTSNALTSTNRLIAEPGVFTLTGNAADLIATYRLSAEPGVFTLTGKPTLFFWSGMSAYNPRRALVIQPENRTLVILREDRTYVVTA